MRNIRGKFDVHQCFREHKQFYEAGQGSYFYQFDYNRLYQLYAFFFGEHNVHVICIEDIIKNQALVLKQIIKDMGLSDRINPIDYMQQKENTRATEGEFWKHQLFYRIIAKRLVFLPEKFRKSLKEMTMSKIIKVTFNEEELKFLKKIYVTAPQFLIDVAKQ